ncbi:MAG TPA: endo-1,4-beta-xylanase [Gammaproteobacteria bacterium]
MKGCRIGKTNFCFSGKKLLNTAVAGLMLAAVSGVQAQLTTGDKYLGNIHQGSDSPFFSRYWNHVTPENAGKWKVVESRRDDFDWSGLDSAYHFAQSHGYPFKQHTFVWRSQEPGWLEGLSQAYQRAELAEFMSAYCRRYPKTAQIDVVNEPLSAPPTYRNALGGNGSSGWDWAVNAFRMARQYCPDAQLLLNEYGIINDDRKRGQYMQLIDVLKSRGLIDGIGIQAHTFNLVGYSVSTLRRNLDVLATAGLPIYVTEWDIDADDQAQLQEYRAKFPVVWEHGGVRGMTLWGYVVGATWRDNTGLMYRDGRERPALQWLRDYFSGGHAIVVRARGASGGESISLKVDNVSIATWILSTGMQSYTASTAVTGDITLHFGNDGSGRDVQVDYIQVNGQILQAEDQSINTGLYTNGRCGGGSNSEWLHCNGHIGFGEITAGDGPSGSSGGGAARRQSDDSVP